jgi:hypothetical protein
MERLTFVIPAHLAGLVIDAPGGIASVTTTQLTPGPWSDVANQIAERYPRLAARVFGPERTLAPGFVLVVNDEVQPRCSSVALSDGDWLSILAAIAGG